MKFEVRERPWDLVFVAVMTAALLFVITISPDSPLRVVLGLPYLLFFPGYVLVSFLFPEEEPLDKIERIALSFGLSIAITPLIGLLLNYLWNISLTPILTSLSIFILVFSALAYLRRAAIPLEERFSIYIEVERPPWEEYDAIDKALVIGTVVLLLVSAGLAVHIINTPRTGERFTQFYVLGSQGMAYDYPDQLQVGEATTIFVGVINNEHQEVDYTLVVGLGRDLDSMTSLGDFTDHLEFPSNNTYYETELTLEHLERMEYNISFSIQEPGEYRFVMYLLRDGDIYRNLHLWIDVRE